MQDPIQEANDAAGDMPQDDELEALRGELEQLKAQSLIERADLDNQRKRIAREIDNARRFPNEPLPRHPPPVFDRPHARPVAAGQQPHTASPSRTCDRPAGSCTVSKEPPE